MVLAMLTACGGSGSGSPIAPGSDVEKAEAFYMDVYNAMLEAEYQNDTTLKAEAKKLELNKKGIRAEVFREEPFTMAQDDLDFHVYLLIWQNGWHKKRVTVEEIK